MLARNRVTHSAETAETFGNDADHVVPAVSIRRGPGPYLAEHGRDLLLQAGFICLLVALWQLAVSLGLLSSYAVSTPWAAVRAGASYLATGNGWHDLWITWQEFFWGMLIAIAAGVPLGILIGWYRTADVVSRPPLMVLMSAPRVAFIPVFLIWLGLGEGSKIAIVVMSAIVPIAITTKSGVSHVDRNLVRVCRAYGGTNRQLFPTIVLPSAVPSIIAGIRVGIGYGVLAVIIGEYLASSAGLGYALQVAGSQFNTGLVFALVAIASAFGLILSGVSGLIERRFSSWRPGVDT